MRHFRHAAFDFAAIAPLRLLPRHVVPTLIDYCRDAMPRRFSPFRYVSLMPPLIRHFFRFRFDADIAISPLLLLSLSLSRHYFAISFISFSI
jgi:hypothetical protein